jgi:uncharacterized protein (DUF302 family)
MSYCFSRILDDSLPHVIERVTEALARQGFGILTRIDVHETLKKKLGVDLPPYVILGACHPQYAHQALVAEPRVGAMMPCNVVVRVIGAGQVEVAAVDPVASLQAIVNPAMRGILGPVRALLKGVVESL